VITSTVPGEGKTTVAASLAAAIAQTGRQVVVVDGDLRQPTLHLVFDLPNQAGLSDVLKGDASLCATTQHSAIDGLHVLTSGPVPADPTPMLGSPKMAAVIEQLAARYDRIIVDTPSLQTAADATILAALVDGVLLVVGRGKARAEGVQTAQSHVEDIGARSIGVVVNRAEKVG
jgi:capsular exopolysaccharide synthesis family protein